MQARSGDVLIIKGKTVGQGERRGTIVEVRSEDGRPPYLVRWQDGHEGLAFPGPDARIESGGYPGPAACRAPRRPGRRARGGPDRRQGLDSVAGQATRIRAGRPCSVALRLASPTNAPRTATTAAVTNPANAEGCHQPVSASRL